MKITRRQFVKGGVAAFTVTYAAPEFLSDLARAQCSANVPCVRAAAQKVGVRWAVTGTVTKVSNLIWYLSAQLIDVTSGRFILDDSFELKGPRDEIVPRGASSFARRIEKAAARGAGGEGGR